MSKSQKPESRTNSLKLRSNAVYTPREIHTAVQRLVDQILGKKGENALEIAVLVATGLQDGSFYVAGIKNGDFIFGDAANTPWLKEEPS